MMWAAVGQSVGLSELAEEFKDLPITRLAHQPDFRAVDQNLGAVLTRDETQT